MRREQTILPTFAGEGTGQLLDGARKSPSQNSSGHHLGLSIKSGSGNAPELGRWETVREKGGGKRVREKGGEKTVRRKRGTEVQVREKWEHVRERRGNTSIIEDWKLTGKTSISGAEGGTVYMVVRI